MSRHYLDIGDGIRISYLDEGRGIPILFIHGFTGTAAADHGRLIDEFRSSNRLIAPDLRGYGSSRPPDRDFPRDFYQRDAADLASLLDGIRCGPVDVFGFSDGAEVSLLLAANRPDLVRLVVAWGVSGVISKEELQSVESWLPVSTWGPERQKWRADIVTRHGPGQLESMIEGWVNAARAIYAHGGDISYGPANRIKCPVLLLNGDREVGNTPRDVTQLAARIPRCHLEFIPDCGHAIHVDQPDILLGHIRRFLASHPL